MCRGVQDCWTVRCVDANHLNWRSVFPAVIAGTMRMRTRTLVHQEDDNHLEVCLTKPHWWSVMIFEHKCVSIFLAVEDKSKRSKVCLQRSHSNCLSKLSFWSVSRGVTPTDGAALVTFHLLAVADSSWVSCVLIVRLWNSTKIHRFRRPVPGFLEPIWHQISEVSGNHRKMTVVVSVSS